MKYKKHVDDYLKALGRLETDPEYKGEYIKELSPLVRPTGIEVLIQRGP